METLELKIFDVLVRCITVEEFENWLYQSKFLEEKLKADSLIFKVVNINYRSEDALKRLKNIADDIFDEKDLLVLKIERNCKKIVNTQVPENIEKYVWNIIEDYDFDIESSIYWEFYSLYHSFDGFEFTKYSKRPLDDVNFRTIKYAKTILSDLRKCKSIKEKKDIIFPQLSSKNEKIVQPKEKRINKVLKKQTPSILDKMTLFFKGIINSSPKNKF